MTVIKGGESLKKFISAALTETLELAKNNHRKLVERDVGIEERQRQSEKENSLNTIDEEDDSPEASQTKPAPVQTEPQKSTVTADPETKNALEKGDVTLDDITQKLNTIRAGKSLKDSVVAAAMQKYLDGLTKAEKTALLAFLQGLTQVVTGVVDPVQAQDPSDDPSNVTMKKSSMLGKQSIKLKPTVIRNKPSSPEKPASSSKENTAPPVPITPVKK